MRTTQRNEVRHGTIDADGTRASLHANFIVNVDADGTLTSPVNNVNRS